MPGGGGIYIERPGSGSLSVRLIPPCFRCPSFSIHRAKNKPLSGLHHAFYVPLSGKAAALCCAEVKTQPVAGQPGRYGPIPISMRKRNLLRIDKRNMHKSCPQLLCIFARIYFIHHIRHIFVHLCIIYSANSASIGASSGNAPALPGAPG